MAKHRVVGCRRAKLIADPGRAKHEQHAERHRHGEDEHESTAHRAWRMVRVIMARLVRQGLALREPALIRRDSPATGDKIMGDIEFWYEFGSTYSYPAVMRIEKLAAQAGVELRWRPFLLGPIFQTLGWNDLPFNILRRRRAAICGAT